MSEKKTYTATITSEAAEALRPPQIVRGITVQQIMDIMQEAWEAAGKGNNFSFVAARAAADAIHDHLGQHHS